MMKVTKQPISGHSATVLKSTQPKLRPRIVPAAWVAVRGMWADRADLSDPVAYQRRIRRQADRRRRIGSR